MQGFSFFPLLLLSLEEHLFIPYSQCSIDTVPGTTFSRKLRFLENLSSPVCWSLLLPRLTPSPRSTDEEELVSGVPPPNPPLAVSHLPPFTFWFLVALFLREVSFKSQYPRRVSHPMTLCVPVLLRNCLMELSFHFVGPRNRSSLSEEFFSGVSSSELY